MKKQFNRVLIALTLAAALTLVGAPAHAAGFAGAAIAFTLDPLAVVQLVIAFVLPVGVGLVTTRVTSAAMKAWLLAGLSLVTSLLIELARALSSGEVYDLGIAMVAAAPAFVVSVATHYGLWKPTGVSAAARDHLITSKEGA